MAVEVEIDVEVLKCEIKMTYAKVSQEPGEDFIFPTGRAWALDLGYPPELLARLPEGAAESFAGVANPFALGTLERGEAVLDVGSGAGTDSPHSRPDGRRRGASDRNRYDPGDARESAGRRGRDEGNERRVRGGRGRKIAVRG
jgi:hypothetical protein